MPTDNNDEQKRLSDGDVLRFLSENPSFFEDYDSILPRLRIPHRSGSATSLIERQVSVLRERCEGLEANLRDFIVVARENENLHGRMHALMQDIVSARSLKQVLKLTQDNLANNFHADGVHILLAGQAPKPAAKRLKTAAGKNGGKAAARTPTTRRKASGAAAALPPGTRILPAEHELFTLFDDLFDAGRTRCGMPSANQLQAVAGDDQANVASAALIPLDYRRRLGVIMLTSRDVERFASGKGVMFLDQFGGLLSRRLHGMRIVAASDTTTSASPAKSAAAAGEATRETARKKVSNGAAAPQGGGREAGS